AGAAGAVHDDGLVLRDPILDLALQVPAGDEHRVRHRSLLVLVELADVDERGVVEVRLGLGRLDLADLLLRLGQQLAEAGHRVSSRSFSARPGSRGVMDDNPVLQERLPPGSAIPKWLRGATSSARAERGEVASESLASG